MLLITLYCASCWFVCCNFFASWKLASTTTTIYGFNTQRNRSVEKIYLKCQTDNLKSELTCHIINAETSYNLLLGQLWICSNLIVLSTLHQCLKYVDKQREVKTIYAEKQSFKGVGNYFTNAILYQEEQVDGSEVDSKPVDSSNRVSVKLNPLVIGLNDININPNADDEGEWVFNEEIVFEYVLSRFDNKSETKYMIIKRLNKTYQSTQIQ